MACYLSSSAAKSRHIRVKIPYLNLADRLRLVEWARKDGRLSRCLFMESPKGISQGPEKFGIIYSTFIVLKRHQKVRSPMLEEDHQCV